MSEFDSFESYDGTLSGSYDEDDDSHVEEPSRALKSAGGGKSGTKLRSQVAATPRLHLHDTRPPPKTWVGNLRSIDDEEAIYELQQSVMDDHALMLHKTFDPLQIVPNTDPLFHSLQAHTLEMEQLRRDAEQQGRHINELRPKNTLSHNDHILNTSSIHFNPVLFLTTIHQRTSFDRMQRGLNNLASIAAARVNKMKRLVKINFGNFLHCRETIELIQKLLQTELPISSMRLSVLLSQLEHNPWILQTLTYQQHKAVYEMLHTRIKYLSEQNKVTNIYRDEYARLISVSQAYNNVLKTFESPSSSTSLSSNQSTSSSSASSTWSVKSSSTSEQITSITNLVNTTPITQIITAIASHETHKHDDFLRKSIEEQGPWAYAADSTFVNNTSRFQRLSGLLYSLGRGSDSLYDTTLDRRYELLDLKDTIQTVRRYRLLFELPILIQNDISQGRADRMIRHYKRTLQLSINNIPTNQILFTALESGKNACKVYTHNLLIQLTNPNYSIEGQKRILRLLLQLDSPIQPQWFLLEQRCVYICNMFDKIYYTQYNQQTSINGHSTVLSSPGEPSVVPVVPKRPQQQSNNTNGQISPLHTASRTPYYNGLSSPTNNNINGLSSNDSLSNRFGSMLGGLHSHQQQQQQQQDLLSSITTPSPILDHDGLIAPISPHIYTKQSTPFIPHGKTLTLREAETLFHKLWSFFNKEMPDFVQLAYTVTCGSLRSASAAAAELLGSSSFSSSSSAAATTGQIDTASARRLHNLLSTILCKFIVYIQSLVIPSLNLAVVDGFRDPIKAQLRHQRSIEALDLAFPVSKNQNGNNSSSSSSSTRSLFNTPRTTTTATTAPPTGDRTPLSGAKTLGEPSTPRTPALGGSTGGSSTPYLAPPSRVASAQSGSGGGRTPRFVSLDDQLIPPSPRMTPAGPLSAFSLLGPSSAGRLSNPPLPSSSLYSNGVGGRSLCGSGSTSMFSSLTDDGMPYTRTITLHHVVLPPPPSVTPRQAGDNVAPVPVAPFSHLVLSHLSDILSKFVAHPLFVTLPDSLTSLLSFYCELYSHSMRHVLLAAGASILTLSEYSLHPISSANIAPATTLPIAFQRIIESFLHAIALLPVKQLFYRTLVYFKGLTPFTFIGEFVELILLFADRLHNIAIPYITPDRHVLDTSGSTSLLSNNNTIDNNNTNNIDNSSSNNTNTNNSSNNANTTHKQPSLLSNVTSSPPTSSLTSTTPIPSMSPGGQLNTSSAHNKQSSIRSELVRLAANLNLNQFSSNTQYMSDIIKDNIITQCKLVGDTETLARMATEAPLGSIASAISPGQGRTLLSSLSNAIYVTNELIPHMWMSLSNIIHTIWPVDVFSENAQIVAGNSNTSYFNTLFITEGLEMLTNKYRSRAQLHPKKPRNNSYILSDTTKATILSASETDDDNTPPISPISGANNNTFTSTSTENLKSEILESMPHAISRALDLSYDHVQGTFLTLQSILAHAYIRTRSTRIYQLIYDALYRGGINWSCAPKPTSVRGYMFDICQLLIEAKHEMEIVGGVDSSAIMISIVDNIVSIWCTFIHSIPHYNYNGSMQGRLETLYLVQSLSRYISPRSRSLIRNTLVTLHKHTEYAILAGNNQGQRRRSTLKMKKDKSSRSKTLKSKKVSSKKASRSSSDTKRRKKGSKVSSSGTGDGDDKDERRHRRQERRIEKIPEDDDNDNDTPNTSRPSSPRTTRTTRTLSDKDDNTTIDKTSTQQDAAAIRANTRTLHTLRKKDTLRRQKQFNDNKSSYKQQNIMKSLHPSLSTSALLSTDDDDNNINTPNNIQYPRVLDDLELLPSDDEIMHGTTTSKTSVLLSEYGPAKSSSENTLIPLKHVKQYKSKYITSYLKYIYQHRSNHIIVDAILHNTLRQTVFLFSSLRFDDSIQNTLSEQTLLNMTGGNNKWTVASGNTPATTSTGGAGTPTPPSGLTRGNTSLSLIDLEIGTNTSTPQPRPGLPLTKGKAGVLPGLSSSSGTTTTGNASGGASPGSPYLERGSINARTIPGGTLTTISYPSQPPDLLIPPMTSIKMAQDASLYNENIRSQALYNTSSDKSSPYNLVMHFMKASAPQSLGRFTNRPLGVLNVKPQPLETNITTDESEYSALVQIDLTLGQQPDHLSSIQALLSGTPVKEVSSSTRYFVPPTATSSSSRIAGLDARSSSLLGSKSNKTHLSSSLRKQGNNTTSLYSDDDDDSNSINDDDDTMNTITSGFAVKSGPSRATTATKRNSTDMGQQGSLSTSTASSSANKKSTTTTLSIGLDTTKPTKKKGGGATAKSKQKDDLDDMFGDMLSSFGGIGDISSLSDDDDADDNNDDDDDDDSYGTKSKPSKTNKASSTFLDDFDDDFLAGFSTKSITSSKPSSSSSTNGKPARKSGTTVAPVAPIEDSSDDLEDPDAIDFGFGTSTKKSSTLSKGDRKSAVSDTKMGESKKMSPDGPTKSGKSVRINDNATIAPSSSSKQSAASTKASSSSSRYNDTDSDDDKYSDLGGFAVSSSSNTKRPPGGNGASNTSTTLSSSGRRGSSAIDTSSTRGNASTASLAATSPSAAADDDDDAAAKAKGKLRIRRTHDGRYLDARTGKELTPAQLAKVQKMK